MITAYAEKEQAKQIVSLLKYICEIHRKGKPDVFVSGEPKQKKKEAARVASHEQFRTKPAHDVRRFLR